MTQPHKGTRIQPAVARATFLMGMLLEVVLLLLVLEMTLGVGFDPTARPVPGGAGMERPQPAPAALR